MEKNNLNYFEILGANPDTSMDTLRQLYKFKLKQSHPDKNSTGESDDSIRIIEAYKVLSDPILREEYTKSLQASQQKSEAISHRFKWQASQENERAVCPQCGEDNGDLCEFEENSVYECVACSTLLDF